MLTLVYRERLPWPEQHFYVVDLLGVPFRELVKLDRVLALGDLAELILAPV